MKIKTAFIKKFTIALAFLISANISSAQIFDYFKPLHGSDYSGFGGTDLDIDINGNKYIIGDNGLDYSLPNTTVDLDPGNGSSLITGRKTYLAKYNQNTDLTWVKTFPTYGVPYFRMVKADQNGNIFVLGMMQYAYANDSIDIDPSPNLAYVYAPYSSGSTDLIGSLFIAKYDQNGNFLFVRTIKSTGSAATDNSNIYATDIIIDTGGNLALSGYFYGNYDFDPSDTGTVFLTETDTFSYTQYSNKTYLRGFVAQYDNNGNLIDAAKMTANNYINSICYDNNGDLFALGRNFLKTDSSFYLNLIKLSGTDLSSEMWRKNIKLNGINDFPRHVRTDAVGNVILSGSKVGSVQSLDLDPGNPGVHTLSSPWVAIFLAKYTGTGSYVWSKSIQGITVNTSPPYYYGELRLNSMDITANGGLILSGPYYGGVDFDPGAASQIHVAGNPYPGAYPSGDGNSFISRYDSSGNYLSMQAYYLTDVSPYIGYIARSRLQNNSLYLFGGTYGFAYFRVFPSYGGTLNNPAYTGPTPQMRFSGFITKYSLCPAVNSSTSASICAGDVFQFGTQTLTSPGTYSRTLTAANGCSDSVIQLQLSVISIDTSVTLNASSLTANAPSATYQWIDCSTNTPVTGASMQSFSPATSGTYKVVITKNGCSDTSACYSIVPTAIEEQDPSRIASVFPNPASSLLNIAYSGNITISKVTVSDLAGKSIPCKMAASVPGHIVLNIKHLPPGMYLLKLQSGDKQVTHKFVKN